MLDITTEQRAQIQRLLHQRLPHVTAVAFGSRVRNWPFGHGPKPYSDLDIALFGLAPADARALAHLRADMEESPLPWRVDLSNAEDLPPQWRTWVSQHGVPLQGTVTGRPSA